jgi:hypothetical protein
METKLTKVITGEVRLSYLHAFAPKSMDGSEDAKYSTSILIKKSDTRTLNAVKAAIEAAKDEGKTKKFGGKVPPVLKTPLRDGDTEKPDDEVYAGHYFLNATSKMKPGIVDTQLLEIIDPTQLYSGCYAKVSLNFFAFNTNGNKGIAAGLNNIQKLRDGDPLGGRSRAEDDFTVVEGENYLD